MKNIWTREKCVIFTVRKNISNSKNVHLITF